MDYTITISDDQNVRLMAAIGKKQGLGRNATEGEVKDAIIKFLKRVTMRAERNEQFQTLITPPTPITPV